MKQQVPCPHCLEPIEMDFHGECPHCGKSLDNKNPEGALPFGTQLAGKYTIGKYLSADGDGLSYRGVNNEEKRFVRIKEYFPVTLCNGRSADGALMPKAGREVLFKTSRMDFKDLYDDLYRLTPATGLSRIVDVIEENNTVYAVEESEKGMTLTHYLTLRSRNLTPAEARTLLQPVMEGVTLLHKAGLIHRGICPDNILLPIDGSARLTGYGTLALRTGGSELKSQLYPGYAAPEQYSASEFSGRYTDVYALAAVTYRLVTGQVPVAAPQRKVRDSLESAHSLESGASSASSESAPSASPAATPTDENISIIPDLVGRDYETEIKGSTLYQNYRIMMTETHSSTVEEGKVISQEPMAGTLQTQQSPIIQIVVSSGPMLVDMPDIIGFTQDNASKLLDAEGIQYRMEIMENDGSYAEGCVAYCELDGEPLAAGTELDAGTAVVTIYIAGERDDSPQVDPSLLASGSTDTGE